MSRRPPETFESFLADAMTVEEPFEEPFETFPVAVGLAAASVC